MFQLWSKKNCVGPLVGRHFHFILLKYFIQKLLVSQNFPLIQNSFVAIQNKMFRAGAKTVGKVGESEKHISGLDMHWYCRTRQAFPFKRKLYIYLVRVIYCCVRVRNWILSIKSGTVSGSGFFRHLFSWTCKVLVLVLVPKFPVCSRRIQRAFGVLPMVPMPSEVLSLAVIGYHWY